MRITAARRLPRPGEPTVNDLMDLLACPRSRCACHNPWKARSHCPAHTDTEPSLSIRQRQDGWVVWHCWAGCAQTDVLKALQAKGLYKQPIRKDGYAHCLRVEELRKRRKYIELEKELDHPGEGDLEAADPAPLTVELQDLVDILGRLAIAGMLSWDQTEDILHQVDRRLAS